MFVTRGISLGKAKVHIGNKSADAVSPIEANIAELSLRSALLRVGPSDSCGPFSRPLKTASAGEWSRGWRRRLCCGAVICINDFVS
jgi:hypothetical protein